MAYKINGTTVVDNSRNVCACCVTSCCITASDRMDAPSGTTAQRPSSPATGSIYFDTDEGALVSYDGTDWKKSGSGSGFVFNDAVSNSCDAHTVGYVIVQGQMCRGRCKGATPSVGGSFVTCQCAIGADIWKDEHPLSHFCGFNCTCGGDFRCAICKVKYRPRGSVSYYSIFSPCASDDTDTHFCQGATVSYSQFPDGSLCVTKFDQQQSCCFITSLNRSTVINSKGAVSQGTAEFPGLRFLSCGTPSSYNCVATNLSLLKFPAYKGSGINGALVPNTCGFLKSLQEGTTQPVGSFCDDYQIEICSGYIGSSEYKVCSTALRKNCTCRFNNPRVVSGPCNPNTVLWCICSGACSGSVPCCCYRCLNRYTFISKDVTADTTNEACFCKTMATSSSGIVEKGAPNLLYNSIAIARNSIGQGGGGCFKNLTTCSNETASFLSGDKRCLFMLYKQCCPCNHCGIFCKTTCTPICCVIYKCFFGCHSPALDVLDLCTGNMICSVYWCDIYDCSKGNPDSVRCHTTGLIQGAFSNLWGNSNTSTNENSGWSPSQGGIGVDPFRCYVRSCNCCAWTYIRTFCSRSCSLEILKFNECSLNFDYFLCRRNPFQSFTCLSHMQFLEMAISGCCSSDCRYSCLCTEAINFLTACGSYVSGRGTYAFGKNLLGYCMMPSPLFCGCTSPTLSYEGFVNLCVCNCGRYRGDYAYINPKTDSLVCFMTLSACCAANCCRKINWVGVVCFDLANNMCISEVNTIFPTSADKCLFALKCGLAKYCQSGGTEWTDPANYECRPVSCSLPNTFQFHRCTGTAMFYPTVYSNKDETEGGVTVQFGGPIWCSTIDTFSRVCSSCQYCSSNVLNNGWAGYFGPGCKGACVPCNTCSNCQFGLENAGTSYISTRVPFDKPLHCSSMFECDPNVKLWMEIALGCHCLGVKAYQCFFSTSTYADAEFCMKCCIEGTIAPGFVSKRDMTCAFTLNCPCIGLFTCDSSSMSCVRCMSQFWDTSTSCLNMTPRCGAVTYYCLKVGDGPGGTDCYCSYSFTNKEFFGTLQELLECDYTQCIACTTLYGGTFACDRACASWRLCYCPAMFPSVLSNITDQTLGNYPNNAEGIYSSSPNLVSHPHNTYESFPNQSYVSGCTIIASNCEYGIRKAGPNTLKGSSGLVMEWFNEGYARICDV